MSRDDRPRYAVLAFAAARTEEGVIYVRGKGCIVLYRGRMTSL